MLRIGSSHSRIEIYSIAFQQATENEGNWENIIKNKIENRKQQRKDGKHKTERSGGNNYLSYHNKCRYIVPIN